MSVQPYACVKIVNCTRTVSSLYNADENLTPVLLTAMHTCFVSHLLVLVLLQPVLTTALLHGYG